MYLWQLNQADFIFVWLASSYWTILIIPNLEVISLVVTTIFSVPSWSSPFWSAIFWCLPYVSLTLGPHSLLLPWMIYKCSGPKPLALHKVTSSKRTQRHFRRSNSINIVTWIILLGLVLLCLIFSVACFGLWQRLRSASPLTWEYFNVLKTSTAAVIRRSSIVSLTE